MSRTIDERIVEMQFNNQQFEQNVKVSMGTLDKLKQALNFGKGKNGFDDLNASARKFDMSGVSNAVTEVHSKFSALEIVGVTALVNIANQAINTGKHMLSSLTIAPISQGFQEYELKMGSVQTIIASTGEKLSTVNKYLEDLNTYSDKTIYSFKDMTSNIGKFTNAGVKLKDAVAAIKGVSNVAAVSGANAAEASRAMYNFSQALSSGAVKLIDWKSIENANMSTVEFKETLLETATALGTVTKEADGYKTTTTNLQGKVSDVFTSTRGFNEALAHQWMTTEVLTQALELYSTDIRELTDEERTNYEEKLRGLKFSDEQIKRFEDLGIKAADAATEVKTFSMLMDTLQEAVGSGWAQTWEILFGDFEEAKKLWTEINNVVGGFIDRQSKARNDLLKAWAGDKFKGREKVITGLSNAFQVLRNVIKPVSDAFAILFPPLTAKKLSDLTDKFVAFTEKAKKATENFPMNIFGKDDGEKTTTELDKVIKKTEKVGETVKDTTETVGKSLAEIRQAVRDTIMGHYGDGMPGDREKALKAAGFDPKAVQDYVNKVHELSGGNWTLSDEIMAAAEASLGLTEEATKQAEETIKATEMVEENVSEVVQNTNFLTSILVSIGTGIKNIFGSATKVVSSFVGAFDEAHSDVKVTRKTVLDFIKTMDKFTGKLKVSEKTLKKVHKTGKDFFITVKTLAALVAKFTLENMPAFLDIAYSVLQIVGKIGGGLTALAISAAKTIVTSKLFAKVFDGLGYILRQLAKGFSALSKVVDYFGEKIGAAKEYVAAYLKEHETARKVTELLSRAFDKVSGSISKFGSRLGDKLGIHTIAEFKKKVDGLISSLSQNFLIPGFEKFVSTIDQLFDGTLKIPSLGEAFDSIKQSIEKFVEKETIFDGFEKAVGKIAEGFGGLKDLVKDFTDGTLPTFGDFQKAFGGFIDSIADHLDEVDWVGVAATAGQIATMVFAFKTIATIARAVAVGRDLVDGATKTMTAIKGFFVKVNGILDNFTVTKTWTAKFKSIAKSVLILSAAIYIVAQALIQVAALKQDELIRAGIAIGAIAFVLTVMEIVLSKAGKGIDIGTATSIVGFAVAIKLVVSAFNDMANVLLEFEGHGQLLQDAFADLVIMMLALIGVVAALSAIQKHLGGFGSVQGVVTVIGFVLALKLLVTVLDDIAKLQITGGIGGFIDFLVKLAVAIKTLSALSWFAGRVKFGGGVGLIAAVLALKLLIMTLDDIASLDIDKILANIGKFIFIGLTLLAIVGIMRVAGENAGKAGVGMLAVAVAVWLLVGVIKTLGEMDPATATQGVVAVLFLMLGIFNLMMMTGAASQYALKAGAAILLISIAINLLVLPIFLLGSMKTSTAARGLAGVLLLVLAMGGLMLATAKAGEYAIQAGVSILLISVAITGLVYTIWMLGNIQSSKLFKAIVAIGLLAVIMGVLMVLSKHTGTSSWTGILAIAGALPMITLSLAALASLPLENIEVALKAIGLLGLVMTALMMASSLTGGSSKASIIIIGVIIGALVAELAFVATKLKGINADSMSKQFEAISFVVVALGGTLGILSAINVSPAVAAKVGLAFDAFAIIIGALIAIVTSLPQLSSGDDFEARLDRLTNAGKLIGSFFKGISEGFSGGQSELKAEKVEEVKTFGERINDLVDNLTTAAGKLDGKESSLESLKGLVDIVGAFAKAEFINGISEFLGGGDTDFGVLGTQLGNLADSLIEFSEKMAGANIDPEVVNVALDLAKKLAELYGMDELKSGGFIQQILGESIGLDKLGEQLYELAMGLNSYVAVINIEDYNDEKIEASKKLLEFLATIYGMDALKSGGFIQSILGESIGLDTLGSQLRSLAIGIADYANEIDAATFSDEKIKASKKLLEMFADLQGAPGLKKGGLLGKLIGEPQSLSTFGSSLGALGWGVSQYAKKIEEAVFTPKKVEASKQLLLMLAGIAKKEIPVSGGLMGALFGGKDLAAFGKSLKQLAIGLTDYVKKLDEAGFTDEQVSKSVRFTNMLSSLARSTEQLNLGKDLTTTAASLMSFSKSIKDFLVDWFDIQDSMELVDTSTFRAKISSILTAYSELTFMLESMPDSINIDFSGVVSQLTEATTQIGDMGAAMVNSLSEGLGNAKSTLSTQLSGIKTTVESTLNATSMMCTTSGAEMANNLGDAFTSGAGTFTTAVENAMKEAEGKITGGTVTGRWKKAGKALAEALAKGIKDNKREVKSAGERLAEAGADGARNNKRDWVRAGESMSEGLEQGIRNGRSGVIRAAVNTALSAYRAAKSALDINSPSRLFAKLGAGIDEGYIKGMRDKEHLVITKSRELVKGMIETSRSALDGLLDLMNSDMIDDPTITPVLDLSEIQNGANKLYSMMDDANRYSLNGNVNLASNTSRAVSADQRRQQESNDQMMNTLINAINGLSALIGNTGNVYNVNGVTYDDGSNVSSAVRSLIRAAKIEGRA